MGLLGPNGAGKTTLISQLAGILPLQQGRISVDDMSLRRSRRKNPGTIDMAPQEYAFYPNLRVRENLQCFGAVRSRKNLTQRVESALAFGRLEAFSQQKTQTLSGGLKRRLNLAIAMLSEPKYLLLDEPTAGVDPQSRIFLRNAIRQLSIDGMGIIYTSHMMDEVENLSDRVVIMDYGKVLCQGGLDELLDQGQSLLTFAQSGLSDDAVCKILRVFGRLQTCDHRQSRQQLLINTNHTASQALNALEQAGAYITYAEFGCVNLEQLFMQLTQRSLRE